MRVVAAMALLMILLAGRSGYAETAKAPDAWVRGPLLFDKRIPVLLKSGAGDRSDALDVAWVLFRRNGDLIGSELRVVMLSWPKGKWRVVVCLLDGKNRALRTAEAVIENGGFIISVPSISEHDLRFSIPMPAEQEPSRYRVQVEPVPENSLVTASLASPAEREQLGKRDRSMEVSVLGVDGKPAERALLLIWRRRPDATPVIDSPSALWERSLFWRDETGRIWEPVLNSSGSVTFDRLSQGFYRVLALTAYPRGADPTPIGLSATVVLGETNATPKVSVQMKGGSSLSVKVVDPKTKAPREGERVVLFLPSGLPLAGDNDSAMLTDKDGMLRFKQLEPGTYRVEVGRHGWWGDSANKTVAVKLKANEPGVVEIPFADPGPQRLPGTEAGPASRG